MNDHDLPKLRKTCFAHDQLERKNAIWQMIHQNYLQQFIDPTDTVDDAACEHGKRINNIQAGRKTAVDPNPDAIDFPGTSAQKRVLSIAFSPRYFQC